MTSISDILLRLAKGIKASGIDASCQSLFKKDMKFVVGGYAQNVVDENDAPFCLVMAENTESNVNTKDILSFNAKVIIGISPLRDVPSTDYADSRLDSAYNTLGLIIIPMDEVIRLLQNETDIAYAEDAKARLISARELIEDDKDDIKSAKDSADYSTMITCYENAISHANDLCEIADEICSHEWEDVEEGSPEAAAIATVGGATSIYRDLEKPKFVESVAALKTEFESYIDDPYIQSATVDGITIFGAQNIMDKMREKVVAAIYDIDVGMILEAVKVNCNSVSHYPLDWSEITVELSLPDVMNTASMSD